MPMDGFTLSYMRLELLFALRGGRVDKVNQPERDALVLLIRSGGGNHRLLLSANANQARAQLTSQTYENPAEPPTWNMDCANPLLPPEASEVILEASGCMMEDPIPEINTATSSAKSPSA